MAGALKTLMTMLKEAPSITSNNVTVGFGEENTNDQAAAPPYVCLVPDGGDWSSPANVYALSPDVELSWSTLESIDLYLWNVVPDSMSVEPIDQADAVEQLRQWVLQAFQTQRAPGGLFYKPVRGRWQKMDGSSLRAGRCYVLTVQVEIAAVTELPVQATITEVTIESESI